MYDSIPARNISSPNETDVLSLLPGEECKALFQNKQYRAKIVAIGKHT